MTKSIGQRFADLLPRRFRRGAALVTVVRLTGPIGFSTPLSPGMTLATVSKALERAFSVKRAKAVALIVNSPGGSPVQSRLIAKRIRDLADQHQRQVLVFVEDAAASGGYFIAVAGDEVIADPSSIVGSVGVIFAGFGFVDAIGKLGIERRVHTAGRNKSTLDPFLPEKREDVDRIKQLELDVHQTFIDWVKMRREGKLQGADDDLFTGEFWSGVRGLQLGLVDAVGDLHETLRSRYGKHLRLRVIAPKRGLIPLPRLGFSSQLGDLAAAVEDRALWARFGL